MQLITSCPFSFVFIFLAISRTLPWSDLYFPPASGPPHLYSFCFSLSFRLRPRPLPSRATTVSQSPHGTALQHFHLLRPSNLLCNSSTANTENTCPHACPRSPFCLIHQLFLSHQSVLPFTVLSTFVVPEPEPSHGFWFGLLSNVSIYILSQLSTLTLWLFRQWLAASSLCIFCTYSY